MARIAWESTVDGSEAGIAFCGKTNSGQELTIYVQPEVIVKLAELIKVTGHGGHATWHYNNPDAAFPCMSCRNKGEKIKCLSPMPNKSEPNSTTNSSSTAARTSTWSALPI